MLDKMQLMINEINNNILYLKSLITTENENILISRTKIEMIRYEIDRNEKLLNNIEKNK